MLECGGFILPFQHPNLPLFTLKDILLPSCTVSLYITLMLCTGAPLGILSFKRKECLVLSVSIRVPRMLGSRSRLLAEKGPPQQESSKRRVGKKAAGQPEQFTLPHFYPAFSTSYSQVIWVP